MADAEQHQEEAGGVIEKSKVLMVGAGGIGCELLKSLVLTGFRHIEVVDLDTIEVSNLNRQFLFRKHHVGQSKAKVACESVSKFRPDVTVLPYHANIKDQKFNVEFFQKFNVVLNGLDNLDARRHVNRLCLAAGVPLIESGTSGYLGQVTVHIKGQTECYECQPKPAPKTYPICTITSTPSKPVHCVVWAKELAFVKFFGDRTQASDLNAQSEEESTKQDDGLLIRPDEKARDFACRVFDHIFGYNIEVALKNEEQWRNRRRPIPLYLKTVLPEGIGTVEDWKSTETVSSVLPYLGLKNPQDVWNVQNNARLFLASMLAILETRSKELGAMTFDKDDQLALEFVTAAANLRAHSFGIPVLSIFDIKGIAGNIVHAIATTNAIIAGLIVIEAVKILRGDLGSCRMTYCVEHPSNKRLLMPTDPFDPNPRCYVCANTPLTLEANSSTTKFRDVIEKIVKAKLGVSSPVVMQDASLLYETGDDLSDDEARLYEANLEKTLAELSIVNGTIISVEDLQQEFKCTIHVKQREKFDEETEPDGMVLIGAVPSSVPQEDKNTEDSKEPEAAGAAENAEEVEVIEDGDVVILEPEDNSKKRRISDESQRLKKQRA